MAERRNPEVARVDRIVGEQGYTIPVPEDSTLRVATNIEQATGGTGPANWWRLGLLAMAVIIAIILVMQWLGGGTTPTPPAATPQTQVSQ